MKRIAALAVILGLTAAALYLAQHRPHPDSVSPAALLDAAADLQRDVSRLPLEATRLSPAEETRIGDALAPQYVADLSPQEQALENYVRQVGARLAAHARRPLNYRFHLIPQEGLVNAFAIPGGHVFIGQGLINQIESEDALGCVLGHEIEHIDHYHPAERVQIEAKLHDLKLDAVAALAKIPMSLWQAGYSKDLELEADREGLRLAVAAGYSPQGCSQIMSRFVELDREYVIHSSTPAGELGEVAIQGLLGYFRSHPPAAERLAHLQAVIAQAHLSSSQALMPLRTPPISRPP
jgi:predicted Zn-dependent protease